MKRYDYRGADSKLKAPGKTESETLSESLKEQERKGGRLREEIV